MTNGRSNGNGRGNGHGPSRGNGIGNARRPAGSVIRCAIYTRKSTEEGLQQEFNSLDAQREAGESYIASQKAEGWVGLPDRYDDGGFTGGNMERPALQRLITDIEDGGIDCVVVYKVDRLSRSLMDFARLMETFDKHGVSFVSVTQQFNTTHSMGRLTLNILLSFAQFEREIISERTRDKIAAARRKGKWSGGRPILGYDVPVAGGRLVVNAHEADRVRQIFALYLDKQSLIRTAQALNARGWTSKSWTTRAGHACGGKPWDKLSLRRLLSNPAYLGKVRYKDEIHSGEHEAIVDEDVWQQVNRSLRSNGRTGGMHVRNKHGALLKGLLHCGPCGCTMSHAFTVKGGKRAYRYYVCHGAQRHGWDTCPSKSVPAEEIERFVVDQIRAIGRDPAVVDATVRRVREQDEGRLQALDVELRPVERELARANGELRRATAGGRAVAASQLAELQERIAKAEQRISELNAERAAIEQRLVGREEVVAALERFDGIWGELTPREQARVLQLLVRRVEYDGGKAKLSVTFHPVGIRTLGKSTLATEPGCGGGASDALLAAAGEPT